MALRRYHRLPWAFLPLFCTNKSCWYVPGFACCPDRFKRSEYRWNRHINSQCKADMDQLGLVWPVDDATVLQKGDQGALFSIPLRENIRRETRPGESPINNERELKLTAPTDTTLCLYRFKIWWMRPSWGNNAPPQTILLLDRSHTSDNNDVYRILLAVPLPLRRDKSNEYNSFASSSLQTSAASLVLCGNSANAGIYIGRGVDPYTVIQEAVELAAGLWSNDTVSSPTTLLPKSVLSHKIGWCTWNAFYTKVTGEKVLDAVTKLQSHIPFRWMILDDGWQDTTTPLDSAFDGEQWSHRLRSVKEHPEKFTSMSLQSTIHQLKHKHNMQKVLVWQTLTGYWLGVDPTRFDSEIQFPKFPKGIIDNDHSASKEASVEQGIGIPTFPDAFVKEYHDYLLECGVDGVKVDAQGVTGVLEKPSAVLQLHNALSLSPLHVPYTAAEMMHCMAHAPEIFFRLPILSRSHAVTSYVRAADDFYPDKPASHASQIIACAFNSLMLGHTACPDWDMFTTNLEEKYLRMHAIARCISGGPIYLSDSPDKAVNTRVVNWLCCTDGTTFPCRQSAVPVLSCLLCDPVATSKPFILFNTNGTPSTTTSVVLGIFNFLTSGGWDASKLDYLVPNDAEKKAKSLNADIRASDIGAFFNGDRKSARYLCICFFSGQTKVLESANDNDSMSMELSPDESEYVVAVPLTAVGKYEVAPLGIDGRINGAGAVSSVVVMGDKRMTLTVSGCGIFSMAISGSVSILEGSLNGETLQIKHIKDNTALESSDMRSKANILRLGFSIIELEVPPCSESHRVVLHFGGT